MTPKHFYYDMDTAQESVKRFLDLDIDRILFYHGGLCDADVKRQLEELTEKGQIIWVKDRIRQCGPACTVFRNHIIGTGSNAEPDRIIQSVDSPLLFT